MRLIHGEKHAVDSNDTQRCPVCRGASLREFFVLESAPIHCNLLHATQAAATSTPMGTIRLRICEECGMVFNQDFDAAKMDYDGEYENSLHFSPRFEEYARALAQRLVDTYAIRRKRVLEIGCGDAHFLRMLCRAGENSGWGFDPSQNLRAGLESAGDDGIVLRRQMFRHDLAPEGIDLLCCRHVLEHIRQPSDLLSEVVRAVGEECVVYFEVPDVRYTLDRGGLWDILYEHCNYFAPSSLSRLFRGSGFRVLRTESAYDGQFLQIDADSHRTLSDKTRGPDDEDDVGALLEAADRFHKSYLATKQLWLERLGAWRAAGAKVAVWGAGTKGVMFLNSLADREIVGFVVDTNPRKRGHYIAGTGHPIISPDDLRSWRPDAVIAMNPAYLVEIQSQLTTLGLAPTMSSANAV